MNCAFCKDVKLVWFTQFYVDTAVGWEVWCTHECPRCKGKKDTHIDTILLDTSNE